MERNELNQTRIAIHAILILIIAHASAAYSGEKELAGVYTGTWSGASGSAGDFRITLTLTAGKLAPDAIFTMG